MPDQEKTLWFKVKVNDRFQSEDGVDLQTLSMNKAPHGAKAEVCIAQRRGPLVTGNPLRRTPCLGSLD